MVPKSTKIEQKNIKKLFWNALVTSWGPRTPLGSIFDRFLSILVSIWGPSWDVLWPLGGPLWSLWASWGLLGALLELLEELQLSLTCTQRPVPQLFPTFPPCPAPQRTPARSTASRPAAYPSALHRVPPRSGTQSAPQFSIFF